MLVPIDLNKHPTISVVALIIRRREEGTVVAVLYCYLGGQYCKRKLHPDFLRVAAGWMEMFIAV